MSETAKHSSRSDVQLACRGSVLDIGSSGSPVVPWAIQLDLPLEKYRAYRADRGADSQIHLRGDAMDLPFKDATLDAIHASHILEDYADYWPALKEWDRVLKPGGFLLIAIPDNARFRARIAAGQGDNLSHKHEGEVGELSNILECGYSVFCDELVAEGDYSILFIGRKKHRLPEVCPVPTKKYNVPWLNADGSKK